MNDLEEQHPRTGSRFRTQCFLPVGPSAPGAKSWDGAGTRNRRERGGWYSLVVVALLAGSHTCWRFAHGALAGSLSHMAHI